MLRNTLRAPALSYPDFRLFMGASFFESIGFMGEQVALSWLVLELTDDPFMVGVALGLRFAPFFFLGILAGTVADMVDRRNLMRVLNLALSVVMLGVGTLVFAGLLEVWHLFALSMLGGCFAALYQTARQSFAFDIVGRGNLVSGLAFSGLGMRLGGLAGSLAAGYIIANIGDILQLCGGACAGLLLRAESVGMDIAGVGVAYVIFSFGYIVSIGLLSLIRSRGQAAPVTRLPVMQNLRDFAIELRRNNALIIIMVIVAATEVLGFSSGTALPSLARDVLDVGPEGLGWLNAARSGGAVLGILLLSLFGEVARKGSALLLTIFVFGSSVILLGQSSTLASLLSGEASLLTAQAAAFAVAMTATAAIGGAMALSDVLSQSLMQNIVPNEQRGRAMGAWLVGIGTSPIGNLQVGAIVAAFGVGMALTANGAALAVIGAAIFVFYARMRRM